MILDLGHADIPNCEECTQWLFDKDWKPVTHLERQGRVRTPRGNSPTPCHKCPKGPAPFENEPTRKTLLSLDYYYRCQADTAGLLQRDRRVIDNNALIARYREKVRQQQWQSMPVLALMTEGSKK